MKLPRWWFYLVIVLVAVAGAIFGPQPDILTLGSADAREPALPLAALGVPDVAAKRGPEPARAQPQPQRFDYFPDHYSNQAKEAAASIETF